MNILIFEDEQYNFDLLCDMLLEQIPDCNVIGPLSTIVEGQRFFAEYNLQNSLSCNEGAGGSSGRLDIIIADIQLNDGLSFYALADAPADVPIIFTTAYDEYALKAFEYNSLSYLLKPIDEDKLREAIRKTQQRMITDLHREEFFALLSRHARYRERFVVNTFKGEKVIHVDAVRYIVSEQKCSYLVMPDGGSFELDKPLMALADELNPQEFMRVNRKYIVPKREVAGFENLTNGKEKLLLRGDNPPEIIVSRDNKEKVHKWLS